DRELAEGRAPGGIPLLRARRPWLRHVPQGHHQHRLVRGLGELAEDARLPGAQERLRLGKQSAAWGRRLLILSARDIRRRRATLCGVNWTPPPVDWGPLFARSGHPAPTRAQNIHVLLVAAPTRQCAAHRDWCSDASVDKVLQVARRTGVATVWPRSRDLRTVLLAPQCPRPFNPTLPPPPSPAGGSALLRAHR